MSAQSASSRHARHAWRKRRFDFHYPFDNRNLTHIDIIAVAEVVSSRLTFRLSTMPLTLH